MAGHDLDDLLRPSLAEEPDTRREYDPAPWRTESLVYPAFFGGTLAVGLLAYIQASRLYCEPRAQRIIVWATLGATAITMAIVLTILGADEETRRYARWINRGVALLLYIGLRRVLRAGERRAELLEVERASLWGPGIAAVVASAATFFVILMALVLIV